MEEQTNTNSSLDERILNERPQDEKAGNLRKEYDDAVQNYNTGLPPAAIIGSAVPVVDEMAAIRKAEKDSELMRQYHEAVDSYNTGLPG